MEIVVEAVLQMQAVVGTVTVEFVFKVVAEEELKATVVVGTVVVIVVVD